MMNARSNVLAGLVIFGALALSTGAMAQTNTRLPTGHAYNPHSQRLPHPNSRQSKIESRADIYETEIYRINRDTAVTFSNMGIFSNGDFLRAGSSNRPRY